MLKKQISNMESRYNNVLKENQFLWKTFMNSKKQQDEMKRQMERICKFISKLTTSNRILDNSDDFSQYVRFGSALLIVDASRQACRHGHHNVSHVDCWRGRNFNARAVQRYIRVRFVCFSSSSATCKSILCREWTLLAYQCVPRWSILVHC